MNNDKIMQAAIKKVKTITAKSVFNYSLNPLASTRNPFLSLGRISEKFGSKKEGVPYIEIHLDHVMEAGEVDKTYKRLMQLSWWNFCGALILIGSALVLFINFITSSNLTPIDTAIEVMKIIVTLLFSCVPFAFSIKYSFLADGVSKNMHFEHPNPLSYFIKNWRSYFHKLFNS